MEEDPTALFQFQTMGEASGPITAAQLRKLREHGTIDRSTLVRPWGTEDWENADHLSWLFEEEAAPALEPDVPPAKDPAPPAAPPAPPAKVVTAPTGLPATPVENRASAPDDGKKAGDKRAPADPARPARRAAHKDATDSHEVSETVAGGDDSPSTGSTIAVAIALVGGLTLGFGVGFWTGRRTAPAPQTVAEVAAKSHGDHAPPAKPMPRSQQFHQCALEHVQFLHSLGAVVGTDEDSPGNPVTSVQITSADADDAVAAHIGPLLDLVELTLRGTTLTDAGLWELRGLTQLKSLTLENAKRISNDGLTFLEGLSALQSLSLAYTPISDAGLVHLENLTHLETLNLARTRLEGSGLQYLAKLSQLKTLELEGTGVTDAALRELPPLPKLKMLGLEGTRVTSSGVREFKRAVPGVTVVGP